MLLSSDVVLSPFLGMVVVALFAVVALIYTGVAAMISRLRQGAELPNESELPGWLPGVAGVVPIAACVTALVWPLGALLIVSNVPGDVQPQFWWVVLGFYVPFLLSSGGVAISLVTSGTWLLRHRHGWLVAALVMLDLTVLMTIQFAAVIFLGFDTSAAA